MSEACERRGSRMRLPRSELGARGGPKGPPSSIDQPRNLAKSVTVE